MKKLFTILLLSISFCGFGQQMNQFDTISFLKSEWFLAQPAIVHSNFDTTVLYEGDAHCLHIFADEKKPMFRRECAVYHGPAGCPDTWLNQNSICIYCLRHINVKETRTVEPVKDEYQEALERLHKKLNKAN